MKGFWKWAAIATIAILVIAVIFLVFTGNRTSSSSSSSRSVMVEQAVISQPISSGTATVAASTDVITWCVQLDNNPGGHIPDLFGQGVKNKYGGTDWWVEKNADGTENTGRTADGCYFIKVSYLNQNNCPTFSVMELKSSEFGWVKVPLTLGTINGESAYIYKR
jgi:hypothetical protein